MTHEVPKDEAPATVADVPPEAIESADRRSFMKGTLTAVSAVAAGGLATSVSAAAQAQAPAARITGTVHVLFDARKQPDLEDLHAALRQIVGRAGCPTCGLGGIDVRLNVGDPIEVQTRAPVHVMVQHLQ
jgi:anaerobic selenocysteine-containing dehydrogenase